MQILRDVLLARR